MLLQIPFNRVEKEFYFFKKQNVPTKCPGIITGVSRECGHYENWALRTDSAGFV